MTRRATRINAKLLGMVAAALAWPTTNTVGEVVTPAKVCNGEWLEVRDQYKAPVGKLCVHYDPQTMYNERTKKASLGLWAENQDPRACKFRVVVTLMPDTREREYVFSVGRASAKHEVQSKTPTTSIRPSQAVPSKPGATCVEDP